MRRKERGRASSSAVLGVLLALATPSWAHEGEKRLIGGVEEVRVSEAGLPFLARVDSGARACSIHATSIEIRDASPNPGEDVGKAISFDVENGKGEKVRVSTTLDRVVRVRSAVGAEERPAVYLTFEWNGAPKRVLVTLRDRGQMQYKLLLGRNWLEDDFVVDVSRATAPPSAPLVPDGAGTRTGNPSRSAP
jgi:hypothetical protein